MHVDTIGSMDVKQLAHLVRMYIADDEAEEKSRDREVVPLPRPAGRAASPRPPREKQGLPRRRETRYKFHRC